MNLAKTFRANRVWAQTAGIMAAIAGLALLAHGAAVANRRDVSRASANPNRFSFIAPVKRLAPTDLLQVKSYLLDFAGDHSLNAATVTEQPAEGHANYTVRLQLASGTEQSVVVAGPPGGLQIEMHDMTGDHVPNDVVLRPALFSWLPTVLVNDGHDHFAIVVAGAGTGSLSSPRNLESRRQDGQMCAFLTSSGFRSVYVPASKRILIHRSRQYPLSVFAQSFPRGVEHASRLNRAPPVAV